MEGRQKTAISARLTKAVDAAKKVKNRSADVIPLSQKYDRMRKKLRNLLQASKNYHSAMTQVDKTRMEVSVIREQAVGGGGILSKSSIYHVLYIHFFFHCMHTVLRFVFGGTGRWSIKCRYCRRNHHCTTLLAKWMTSTSHTHLCSAWSLSKPN